MSDILPPPTTPRMSTYRLTEASVVRDDGLHIPMDLFNAHWQEYQEWLRTGNTPLPMAPEPQEDIDRRTRRTELKTNAILNTLRTATPQQIDTYIDNQVTTLLDSRRVLKALAIAISVLLKEGL